MLMENRATISLLLHKGLKCDEQEERNAVWRPESRCSRRLLWVYVLSEPSSKLGILGNEVFEISLPGLGQLLGLSNRNFYVAWILIIDRVSVILYS
jgi:hypothetical protein